MTSRYCRGTEPLRHEDGLQGGLDVVLGWGLMAATVWPSILHTDDTEGPRISRTP